MAASVQLRLSGPMDHLTLVWQVGEVLLQSVPFRQEPEGTRYNTLLATQEVLTNVLRHAHCCDDTLPIELEMCADQDGYTVEVRDRGEPFDPLTHVAAGPGEARAPLRPGGLGLLIVRMVMDALEYRRDGDQNVLRMEKRAHAGAPAVGA